MYENQPRTLREAEAIYAETGTMAMSDRDLMMLVMGTDKGVDRVMQYVQEGSDCGLTSAQRKKAEGIKELLTRFGNYTGRTITCPGDLYKEVMHYAFSSMQEQMIIVELNGAHNVIGTYVASVGLLNRTLVHPREVFAKAIADRCCAIALAHNHPSGKVEPSDDDRDVTDRLRKCGDILGIRILDHIVFSEKSFYSFLEHGLL